MKILLNITKKKKKFKNEFAFFILGNVVVKKNKNENIHSLNVF